MTPLRPTALAPALRPEADAAPPASDARECGCPEWIACCVHFAGSILLLWDAVGGCTADCDNDEWEEETLTAYQVATYTADLEWVACPCGGQIARSEDFVVAGGYDDYDAALRAFRDAEVRLLQGEEEGR